MISLSKVKNSNVISLISY